MTYVNQCRLGHPNQAEYVVFDRETRGLKGCDTKGYMLEIIGLTSTWFLTNELLPPSNCMYERPSALAHGLNTRQQEIYGADGQKVTASQACLFMSAMYAFISSTSESVIHGGHGYMSQVGGISGSCSDQVSVLAPHINQYARSTAAA